MSRFVKITLLVLTAILLGGMLGNTGLAAPGNNARPTPVRMDTVQGEIATNTAGQYELIYEDYGEVRHVNLTMFVTGLGDILDGVLVTITLPGVGEIEHLLVANWTGTSYDFAFGKTIEFNATAWRIVLLKSSILDATVSFAGTVSYSN